MSATYAVLHQVNGYSWNPDRQRWEAPVTALTIDAPGGPTSPVFGFDGAAIALTSFEPASVHALAQAWAEAAVAASSEAATAFVGKTCNADGTEYVPA